MIRTRCDFDRWFGMSRSSSSTCGTAIMSRSSDGLAIAEPCSVFSRSAAETRVERPRATSMVMWFPPTAIASA